jgi:dTDP-glucose 4,6-dehydratase/UDP-glucose 4-epimerase
MIKVLIIGAKGFIGTHLTKYLKNHFEVYPCDIVLDSETPNFIFLDPLSSDFTNVFKETSFDFCINCSGAANVGDSIKDPLRDFTLNTVNVFGILDSIRRYNPDCKFINLSSAAVYGNPQYLPIDEKHPLNPISPYGHHKLYAEQLCKEFTELYNLKTCSLRIFSAYGRGLRKQLFWDLNKKIATTNLVELSGTGSESRDFIHINDVVESIVIAMNMSTFKADLINVASGIETEISEAARTFYSNFDKKISVKFSGKFRAGDPKNWVANIDKITQMGFVQGTSLQEGLKNYKEWIVEQK